jgi:hypothetical protein
MKKLLVAALMVVLPLPAFAAIQNVKVSGDITTSYEDLNNFNLGYNNLGTGVTGYNTVGGLKHESDFITQTRLRVDADLSDNVSTTVGLVNERAWNAEGGVTSGYNSPTGYDTNVQLYLASLTLREFLYSPLTLQIGRQVFTYGNGFIMGDGGAINQGSGNLTYINQGLTERTAYDGVTATLDYKPLTVSLIYFKNGQTGNSVAGVGGLTSGQSSDVYGYNANYQLSDPWSTVVEQYLFSRVNGSGFDGLGAGGNKGDTLYVPGLRASTNPTKSLNVPGEVAWQLGNIETASAANSTQFEGEHRDAMAAQFLATYTLPVLDKYKPSVNASYTYVSGDKNAGTNGDDPTAGKSGKTYGAWDEFNTIQGAGTIYRAILPMSNQNILSAGASISPLEDLTASVTWSDLWAADKNSANNPLYVYQPNESTSLAAIPVVPTTTKKDARGLGNETDISLTYNYTEDVTFGVSLGWFIPGSELSDATREDASQAIANVGVKF